MILKNEFLRLIIQRFYLLKKIFFFLKKEQQKVYRQYRSPENSSNQ